MNYLIYKSLHLLSLICLFLSFGIILVSVTLAKSQVGLRKFGFALHGISWLLLFITAFGLVSALELHSNFPNWAKAKTVIWFLLGISVFLMKWKSSWTKTNILLLTVFGFSAIWLAVAKPILF